MRIGAGTPAHLAQRGLDAKLYNQYGELRGALIATTRNPEGCVVSVLEDEQYNLQGICLIEEDGRIQVFVREEHRGKGWGRKLVQMACIISPRPRSELQAGPGDAFVPSVDFWRREQIPVHEPDGMFLLPASAYQEMKAGNTLLLHKAADRLRRNTVTTLYLHGAFERNVPKDYNSIKNCLAELEFFLSNPVFDYTQLPCHYIVFHMGSGSCGPRFYSTGIAIERSDGSIEIQLYVDPTKRKQGMGQKIIDTIMDVYPGRTYWGYHTDTSRSLLLSNGIKNLRKELDEYPVPAGTAAVG